MHGCQVDAARYSRDGRHRPALVEGAFRHAFQGLQREAGEDPASRASPVNVKRTVGKVRRHPGPLQRLAFDSPNTAISAFPLVLIPTVLVPLSVLLHVFSLRSLALARGRRKVGSPSGLAYSPKTF